MRLLKTGIRMKSFFCTGFLMVCLLLQIGCDLTLKRKSTISESTHESTPGEISEQRDSGKPSKESAVQKEDTTEKTTRLFSEHDIEVISLYYKNEANAQVLDDMLQQTWVNNKIEDKITVGESIPPDVQVMPLPLELEKILSPLSRYALRVQVGKRVIMMDIKSRRILDVIKLGKTK
jgi:hypothetical protein